MTWGKSVFQRKSFHLPDPCYLLSLFQSLQKFTPPSSTSSQILDLCLTSYYYAKLACRNWKEKKEGERPLVLQSIYNGSLCSQQVVTVINFYMVEKHAINLPLFTSFLQYHQMEKRGKALCFVGLDQALSFPGHRNISPITAMPGFPLPSIQGLKEMRKKYFFYLPDLLSISLQYTKCTATLSSSESKEILQSGNFISNPAQLWAWLPSLLPTHQQLFNAIPHLMQAPLQDYNCINKRVHMFSVFPPPPIYFSPSIHSFSFFFQVLCTVSDT